MFGIKFLPVRLKEAENATCPDVHCNYNKNPVRNGLTASVTAKYLEGHEPPYTNVDWDTAINCIYCPYCRSHLKICKSIPKN